MRDRQAALTRALPSWLQVELVDELVIVDWGSHAPLTLSALPHDRRVRLVGAPLETEWNLARAYNLAAQVARGVLLLKVDSDTWLDRTFVMSHLPIPSGAFVAGDWRRAPDDENAQHLNGVLLVRRADFFAVSGYDERLRGYGWDDTDLYGRLQEAPRSLRRLGFANDSLIAHDGAAHAHRGASWAATEFLHRRAVSAVWRRWHDAGLMPSTWALLETPSSSSSSSSSSSPIHSIGVADRANARLGHGVGGGATDAHCRVRCVRRPPYINELASEGGGLMEVEWRHAYSAAIGRIANGTIPPRALQRVADVSDYCALLRVYEGMAARGERWLGVHVVGALPARLLVACSALAWARWHRMRLVIIWSADEYLRAPLTELVSLPGTGDAVLVVGHYDARLFPAEFWRGHVMAEDDTDAAVALAAALRHTPNVDDTDTNTAAATLAPLGVFVRSTRPLPSVPPLGGDESHVTTSRCLRDDLQPSSSVSALMRPLEESASAAAGVHYCATSGGATVTDRARPAALAGARWDAALATASRTLRLATTPPTSASAAGTAAAAAAAATAATTAAATADNRPPPSPTWEVECTDDGAVRAMHALRTLQPGRRVLLVLSEPGRWMPLRARMQTAGLAATLNGSDGALISLVGERARARCMTAASRREVVCAQIELAEWLLLGRTTTLVRSVGCVASDVASHLTAPGTMLHTCCHHHGATTPLAFIEELRPFAGTLPAHAARAEPHVHAARVSRRAAAHAESEREREVVSAAEAEAESEVTTDVKSPVVSTDEAMETIAHGVAATATNRSRGASARLMTSTQFRHSALAHQGSVQVELMHSPLIDARLSPAMRAARLVFLAPPSNRLRSLAVKIRDTLRTTAMPQLILARGGTPLSDELTVAEAQLQHATGGRPLQISVHADSL